MVALTLNDYLKTNTCKCGGPVFKYIDSTNGIYVIKCGYLTQEYDIKKKEMILSKRQPCNYLIKIKKVEPISDNIINESSRINMQSPRINPIIIPRIIPIINKDSITRHTLEILFKYLFISKKRNTLQEINNIVKNKLLKEPNFNYYNDPSLETHEEYYDRIFSEEIKNKVVKNQEKKVSKPKIIVNETINNILKGIIKSNQRSLTKQLAKLNMNECDFLTDNETDSDSGSDSNSVNSDSDIESEVIGNEFDIYASDNDSGSDYSN